MNIKLIIIIGFSYLYGFFEIFMALRQRKNVNVSKSEDKGSLWILIISITTGYILSFMIGATKTGRIYYWNIFFVIGALLVIIGLVIRIISIQTLRKYFTYSVSKVEKHELIEIGLYKKIRHPGYLGQLIIFTGISASMSNWLSILFMLIPVLTGFIYRIKVEEEFMIKQMGTQYLDYQKRTKRLIPGIF